MSQIKLGALVEERSYHFVTNRYISSDKIVWVNKKVFSDVELKCSAERRLGWQKTGYPQLEILGSHYPCIPYRGRFYVIKR